MSGGAQVRCVGLTQRYDVDGESVLALDDVHLDVPPGSSVALFGPSGSGKSTLTALIAGLRRPTAGQVFVGDTDLTSAGERELLRMRSETIGVVLQNPGRSLLPYATAEQNIDFARRPVPQRRRGALPSPRALLDDLGLGGLAGRVTGRLSGGEQQRLSVAVAMATAPVLLLADEPTSQLDAPNRDRVVDLLVGVVQRYGTTLLGVTHDPAVADRLDRRVTLRAGRIDSDVDNRAAR